MASTTDIYFYYSGGWEVPNQGGTADSVPGEGPLPGLPMATFSLWTRRAEGDLPTPSSSYKGAVSLWGPSPTTSSKPNYLAMTPPPTAITLQIITSTYEYRGTKFIPNYDLMALSILDVLKKKRFLEII